MESDCKDIGTTTKSEELLDMKALFASLSKHISSQTIRIQEQITQNDSRMLKIHENFKNVVQSELEDLRLLVANQQKFIDSQLAALLPTQSPPVTVASLSPPSPVMSTSSTVLTSPIFDFQSQLLLTLTESFGKLSSALTDQKQDSKTEWPKFSGDSKKFCAWYLGIIAQISLSPWLDLYDSSKNDVVTLTTNSTLNGKLYSKLLLALDGPTYQHFVSRKHLRANGILLLQELVQTYKPKNVPEIIVAKTA
jgi:hypothetical protein